MAANFAKLLELLRREPTPITLITTVHTDLLECRSRSGKRSPRSSREDYLRSPKWQFIGSRNLYEFGRQPYAVWLQHSALLNGSVVAITVERIAPQPSQTPRNSSTGPPARSSGRSGTKYHGSGGVMTEITNVN
jgi:hypothetical protein